MVHCVNCQQLGESYEGTQWCVACVRLTLAEQDRERFAPVTPQVFER